MRQSVENSGIDTPIVGVADRIIASMGKISKPGEDPSNLIVRDSGNNSHPIIIEDISDQLLDAPNESRSFLRRIIRQDWPLSRRISSNGTPELKSSQEEAVALEPLELEIPQNLEERQDTSDAIPEHIDETPVKPQNLTSGLGYAAISKPRIVYAPVSAGTSPELLAAKPEANASRRPKLSQQIGLLALGASVKIKNMELGKKAREYKDSLAATAHEVTMDIAERINNINVSETISDVSRRASLVFANTVSSASTKLERHATRRNNIGLAAGMIVLAAAAYTTHRYGYNPIGGNANVAEKSNNANDLLAVAKPIKLPDAEHAQAAHAVLGPKTSTEHPQALHHLSTAAKPQHHETLSAVTVAHHKPKIEINVNDLPWNVAHQKAPDHETQLINDALKSYGHGAHLVGSNNQIELNNGKIVNFQQMREINQLIVKARA